MSEERAPAAPAMSSRLKPFAFVAAVFVLGGVAGAAGARAYTMNELRSPGWSTPEARVESRLQLMNQHVRIRDEQADALRSILLEVEEERERALAPCKADLDGVRAKGDARIEEILDPEQRARYAELRAARRGRK